MAETTALLKRRALHGVPGVRIPPSPPSRPPQTAGVGFLVTGGSGRGGYRRAPLDTAPMRTLALAAVLLAGPAAAQSGGAGDAPTDARGWVSVEAPSGRSVYVQARVAPVVHGVVDVWTWHAFEDTYRPARGPAYDRVVAYDRVYCRLRASTPLREVRYRRGASVGAFMYPGEVGPFVWGPASVAEAVGEHVCGGRPPVSEQRDRSRRRQGGPTPPGQR